MSDKIIAKNSTADDSPPEKDKLGLFALIAIVVGSMLGGGIFSLPQNMSQTSAVGPVIIAWLITGVGVYFIANSFRILSDVRPDLTAGIYMYAREGYGPFMGFSCAWGYWLMASFGNVAFAVILMDSFDYFFPGVFTGGNNLASIICGSILIWMYNFLVLSGVRQAGSINIIGTIAKLVPLVLFVIIMGVVFDYTQFSFDVWGLEADAPNKALGSLPSQIMAPLLVSLWAFIGVEGAVVISGRALNPKDVGKATSLGFLIALAFYVVISVLPFGFTTQSELSTIANPSTAGVLQLVVGEWGAWLMNVGLIISVLAGWLAWTIICAEIPHAAGKNGTFPKAFAVMNKHGSASVSLWVSSAVMQAALLLAYFANDAWNLMLSITTVMVMPAYLASALFLYKICRNKSYDKYSKTGRTFAMISGLIGSIFSIFLFYAGGLEFIMMIPIMLTLGIPIFIWARKESHDGEAVFEDKEWWYVGIILLLALIAIALFYTGTISF